MKYDDICREIIEIMSNQIGVNDRIFIPEGEARYDDYLLGDKIRLAVYDMVYLLYAVEKRYGITFNAGDLSQHCFETVSQIAHAICSKRCCEV